MTRRPIPDDLQERLRAAMAPYGESGAEPGGALCVVRDREVVAEVCVGTMDGERPWRPDTLVMSYSVAKPLAGLATLSVVAEGVLELDQPVAEVWPEYAVAGKAGTTVRHLLRHASGLFAFPEAAADLAPGDTEALTALLAAAAPAHVPGEAFGEQAATHGHLLGEVVRRATGETLEERWERIAADAGWDLHLRAAEADDDRVATVVPGADDWPARYLDDPHWAPALGRPPGLLDPEMLNDPAWRRTPFAAINLHASARGLAYFHDDVLRPDGYVARLLGPELHREYVAPQSVGRDLVLDREVTWTLGHQRDDDALAMGGAGGCAGWVSFASDYAVGSVTRGLGGGAAGDAADALLIEVLGA